MIKIPSVLSVELDKIQPDSSNPNVMSDTNFEALKKNIKKFGFLIPIITNKDYVIADGYHRYKAASELNMINVPVLRLDLKEVDRRILRQVMNKLKGSHNLDMDLDEYEYLKNHDALEGLKELLPDEFKSINDLLNPKEHEDIVLNNVFEIAIECNNEEEQQKFYEKLQKEGYTCRLLTL